MWLMALAQFILLKLFESSFVARSATRSPEQHVSNKHSLNITSDVHSHLPHIIRVGVSSINNVEPRWATLATYSRKSSGKKCKEWRWSQIGRIDEKASNRRNKEEGQTASEQSITLKYEWGKKTLWNSTGIRAQQTPNFSVLCCSNVANGQIHFCSSSKTSDERRQSTEMCIWKKPKTAVGLSFFLLTNSS